MLLIAMPPRSPILPAVDQDQSGCEPYVLLMIEYEVRDHWSLTNRHGLAVGHCGAANAGRLV
jgi:hypothetical protein